MTSVGRSLSGVYSILFFIMEFSCPVSVPLAPTLPLGLLLPLMVTACNVTVGTLQEGEEHLHYVYLTRKKNHIK